MIRSTLRSGVRLTKKEQDTDKNRNHWKEENRMAKPYKRFQSQGQANMAYRCSQFNANCLLSCRDNLTMICFLCRRTVTLHQGQGHRYEHG